MEQSDYIPNISLEGAMLPASEGSKEAIEAFYQAFLSGPLYVPERTQEFPMSDAPVYPNDLINVLGIAIEDRVVIPVFSNPKLLKEWFGKELEFRKFEGQKLIEIIPDEWWLTVNPGSELNKDITPWETKELRFGPDAIPALLSELNPQTVVEIETEAIPEGEFQSLKNQLLLKAKEHSEIKRMFLMLEKGKDLEGREVTSILLGLLIKTKDNAVITALENEMDSSANRAQIGDYPVKVLSGNSSSSLSLGLFKGITPFYEVGLLAKTADRLANLLKSK